MKEYLLTTNEFLNPAEVKGSDAYAVLLMRLLLLEPGTNPLHPAMGVGLGPKYRFVTENEMSMLQTLIQDQINTYLPSDFISTTQVYISVKPSKYLLITIVADDTKYTLDTEENVHLQMQLEDIIL